MSLLQLFTLRSSLCWSSLCLHRPPDSLSVSSTPLRYCDLCAVTLLHSVSKEHQRVSQLVHFLSYSPPAGLCLLVLSVSTEYHVVLLLTHSAPPPPPSPTSLHPSTSGYSLCWYTLSAQSTGHIVSVHTHSQSSPYQRVLFLVWRLSLNPSR